MTTPSQHKLTREQKVGFSFLLIFSILLVGLGFLQMRNTIYSPFVFKLDKTPQASLQQLFSDEEVRLQALDTDKDGVNNYEELYYYNTSPYLPDTDSDGIGDKEELEGGSDPLCPEGEICSTSDALSSTSTGIQVVAPTEAPQAPDLSVLDQIAQGASAGEAARNATPEDIENVVSNADAIRNLLRNTGQISEEQLDAISDEDLLSLVQDVVSQEASSEESLPSE